MSNAVVTSKGAERFTLVRVEDLRPINWASGKREPLPAGEGHVCDRCGALHAVVYRFLGNLGTALAVGSTCATKDLGLGVTKRELARAEREAFTDAQEAEMTRLVDLVKNALRAMGPIPTPARLEVREETWGTREAWGAGDVKVWCHAGFDSERARCFRSAWVNRVVHAAVTFTEGFNAYEVIARAHKETLRAFV